MQCRALSPPKHTHTTNTPTNHNSKKKTRCCCCCPSFHCPPTNTQQQQQQKNKPRGTRPPPRGCTGTRLPPRRLPLPCLCCLFLCVCVSMSSISTGFCTVCARFCVVWRRVWVGTLVPLCECCLPLLSCLPLSLSFVSPFCFAPGGGVGRPPSPCPAHTYALESPPLTPAASLARPCVPHTCTLCVCLSVSILFLLSLFVVLVFSLCRLLVCVVSSALSTPSPPQKKKHPCCRALSSHHLLLLLHSLYVCVCVFFFVLAMECVYVCLSVSAPPSVCVG